MNNMQQQTKPSSSLSDADRTILRGSAKSLEEMLYALTKYGKPRLSHDGKGWYCAVEMYVTAAGVDFKVASDFGCNSPMSAATQCASRLDKALSDIGA